MKKIYWFVFCIACFLWGLWFVYTANISDYTLDNEFITKSWNWFNWEIFAIEKDNNWNFFVLWSFTKYGSENIRFLAKINKEWQLDKSLVVLIKESNNNFRIHS